jgi:5'(3')-deoxyribonucleotidase
MKIGIDVDGVLRDFCQGLESVVKKHYPQYLPEDYKGINNWKLSDNFVAEKSDLQKIYWDEYSKEIMGESPAFEENVEQMKRLIQYSQEPEGTSDISFVCVTSQKPHARHHTLSWLGKYGLNFDTVYFRKGWQKWMVDVDYLVDDSPNNFENWVRGRGMQEGFILMDRPYNGHIKSNCRIKELKQIKEIING